MTPYLRQTIDRKAHLEERNIILETRGIIKQFPKVLANNNISIKLHKGEIISLLGENGAGKSTLMNMLYGLFKPTAGEIFLKGKPVEFDSPRQAIEMGLGMVHQHFMLVDTLTVTENIILGMEPSKAGVIDYKGARKEVQELSEKYHLHVDPDARIDTLTVGLQQRVEILKALYRKADILILDEPTAVLTPGEVEELFKVIRKLRDNGVSVIIITHKLEEVKAISDRVYILRRGEISGEKITSETSSEELANLMVGRDVVLTVERGNRSAAGETKFTVKDLTVLNDNKKPAINNLSLDVAAGEIVGIAGVDGNGQTELAEALMGLMPVGKGSVFLNKKDITHISTNDRIKQGMGYVPTDRHGAGLILPFSLWENILIGEHQSGKFQHNAIIQATAIQDYSRQLVQDFDIRASSVHDSAESLSGGNQQKVILAREMSRNPDFLLVSQPTRGLDVGAIEYIHKQILKIRKRKAAVLLISLELEEIFALSDRILVLYEGKIVKEFNPEETNEKEVGLYMTGGSN